MTTPLNEGAVPDAVPVPLADAQMLLTWMNETFGNDDGMDWQDEGAAAVGDALDAAIENFKRMRAALATSVPPPVEAREPLTRTEVDARVYQCRQAGDDSTYALVRAVEATHQIIAANHKEPTEAREAKVVVQPSADRQRVALAELVACEDMRRSLAADDSRLAFSQMPRSDYGVLCSEYNRRKDAAWVQARAALAAPHEAETQPSTDSREAEARAIYEQWKNTPGWVPWVDGGNSNKQDDARRLAASQPSVHPSAHPGGEMLVHPSSLSGSWDILGGDAVVDADKLDVALTRAGGH